MAQSVTAGDLRVSGTVSAQAFNLPAGTVKADDIEAAAGVEATKLEHQHALHYDQAAGSDVASQTRLLHTFRAPARLVDVQVCCAVAPTGGDKAFTVDIKLGSQGVAFATILSGVVTINSTKADREVVDGTISTLTAVAGDTLEVVVAASGSTGSQGQGLAVTVTVREDAE